jgi:YidC/Oxa1 family membrane protein insertase
MDKRSLLFLTLLTTSYFGLHTFFKIWDGDASKSLESKAAIERLEKGAAAEQERLARSASLNELPLAEMFTDPLGRGKAGNSLRIDDTHYMTLAWQAGLPAKLYVPIGETFEVLTITGPTVRKVGDVVLYLKEGTTPTPIELPSIPMSTDLHLLPLQGELEVVLAERRGTDIVFPYAYLDRPAIAFMKNHHHYIPVGVFEPAKNKITPFSDFDYLHNLVKQESVPLAPTPSASESFYVLETEYQQLVFSSRGGSLAEINLPLKTSKDSKSLIKEIDIDRKILADSPQNAHFPLHPYSTPAGEQVDGSLGGYYPLLRRPIMNADGTEKTKVPPQLYALTIFADSNDAPLNYRVQEFNSRMIQFVASDGRRRISKTYSLPEERRGPYCFDLEIQIDGDTQGLWIVSGVPDVELVGGSYTPQIKYQVRTSRGTDVEEIKLPKESSSTDLSLSPYWISNCNGFLGLIIDPLSSMPAGYKIQKINGAELPTRLSTIDAAHHLYPAENYPGYMTLLPLKSGTTNFRIFAGPYDEALLKELDELYGDPTKNYSPEYTQSISIQGWFSFISQPFSKFLFFLMQLFYAVTNSWAISIILLTVALRAMMYPLNNWSIRSTVKMQEVAPKVKIIKERYKKYPQRAKMEEMKLYKEAGVNPFSGCLPMLLQVPFLMGMFYMLKSSFPLRGAPFMRGWIDDLASPDILFSWNTPIWLIGNEFHLLPILTGLVMFIQGKMTQKFPKDPKLMTDAQKQQKMMGITMAVVFTFMFYNVSSGLNIYFMFSTLLGIAQQKFLMKKNEV